MIAPMKQPMPTGDHFSDYTCPERRDLLIRDLVLIVEKNRGQLGALLSLLVGGDAVWDEIGQAGQKMLIEAAMLATALAEDAAAKR
jgi:hypothetical protein